MRRDAVAMLFWALRWHEGRRISWQALSDLLWGEFACKPQDAAGSIRELMTYVGNRYGDEWTIDDSGRGYRISPRSHVAKAKSKPTAPIMMGPASSGSTRQEQIVRRRRAALENRLI